MTSFYMGKTKVIVDSNLFIALVISKDSLSVKADNILREITYKKNLICINQYIRQEALTVSSIREKNIKPAEILIRKFFSNKNGIEVFQIPQSWEKEITELFLTQQKYKGELLSYIDCSLIVQARKQGIKSICTFDETFKQFAKEFIIFF